MVSMATYYAVHSDAQFLRPIPLRHVGLGGQTRALVEESFSNRAGGFVFAQLPNPEPGHLINLPHL